VIDGGFGNDTINVRAVASVSTVLIFGQSGNDRFNVGSTLAENNGNLGLIRGELWLYGGSQADQDTLYINDNGVQPPYNYRITDSVISHLQGPNNIDRDQFTAIRHDGMEFVRLDGTPGNNLFSVAPSLTTSFHINGGRSNGLDPRDPANDDADFEDLNLDFLLINSNAARQVVESNGDGFVDFENSLLDIVFENIFLFNA